MTQFGKVEVRINGKLVGLLSEVKYDVEYPAALGWRDTKPKTGDTQMAEAKVVVVTAGDDFVKALEKLIGASLTDLAAGKVPQSYGSPGAVAVGSEEAEDEECDCPDCSCDEDEDEVPATPFGTVLSNDEDANEFTRIYSVSDPADLNVVVTKEGVVVEGSNFAGEHFDDLFAPNGAFDEVEARFDAEDDTLVVSLVKVEDEGKTVEIDGW